jgi:hypothetical protein
MNAVMLKNTSAATSATAAAAPSRAAHELAPVFALAVNSM